MKIKGSVQNIWDEAVAEIQCLAEEMRTVEENMSNSEGLSATRRYEAISQTADNLEEAQSLLEEIKILQSPEKIIIVEHLNGSKRISRPKRLQNYLIMLDSIKEYIKGEEEEENFQEALNYLEVLEFPSMFG